EAAAEALTRMAHDVSVHDDELVVEVAAWRSDVLHEVDLIEDIAIGHGFEHLTGQPPRAVTYGQALPTERFDQQARRALTGLGYLECMTLTLTSKEEQQDLIGTEDPVVEMENPESSEQAVMRRRLVPALLTLASRNTHRDLPQRLFEVGDVVVPAEDQRPSNVPRVGGLEVASDASFTRIKSHVEALLRALDQPYREEAGQAPGFAKGRTARLVDPETDRVLGHYGEIEPQVLDAFELGNPAAGFELRLRAPQELETWSPAEAAGDQLDLRGA
ncbi:MAG: hypothetical protein R3185_08430, partial [Candidatus Thermoplasmatota archaeon]|nr:hypothetical protein [Candidatus Thermoplasmatota archaeon]